MSKAGDVCEPAPKCEPAKADEGTSKDGTFKDGLNEGCEKGGGKWSDGTGTCMALTDECNIEHESMKQNAAKLAGYDTPDYTGPPDWTIDYLADAVQRWASCCSTGFQFQCCDQAPITFQGPDSGRPVSNNYWTLPNGLVTCSHLS